MELTIWLYCLFGNEAKIMPYFLRHYAPQVDRLIMLDGGCTDGTPDLLLACPQVTIETRIDQYPCDAPVETVFASAKYREARGQADYIVWVDADEFLFHPQHSLRSFLRQASQEHAAAAIQSQGYQMLADEFPVEPGDLTDLVTRGVRNSEYDKVNILDPAVDARWTPGHHGCRLAQGVEAYRSDLRLLHYRYFGEAHLRERNAFYYAHLSAAERDSGRSYQSYPGYQTGKYSLAWYKNALSTAREVVRAESVTP